MVFSKKWLQNHENFLLHFQIHIDALMLCSKSELIPTKIFQVITIQLLKDYTLLSISQNHNFKQAMLWVCLVGVANLRL